MVIGGKIKHFCGYNCWMYAKRQREIEKAGKTNHDGK